MTESHRSQLNASKHDLIAAYKGILRDIIDQRPSGMRQKIAQMLGTHKSFISQISNPSDPTPIPSRHLEAIVDVCHFSPAEKQRFLEAYAAAHPESLPAIHGEQRHYKTLHIQIPVLADPHRQRAVEQFIRDTVRRLCTLLLER